MAPALNWGISGRGLGWGVWLILLLLPLLSPVGAQPCGRYHRVCARNASCEDDFRCVCNDDLHGDPLVECVEPPEFQCVIKSDPHIDAFGGATGNLNFPCKYRMTRVQTNLQGAVPGLSFCSFEVFGFNEVLNGRYYTSGVEISFAIGDFANQIFRQEDIIKFDVNQAGVQSSTGDVTVWGSGTHSTWNGVEVTCSFDDEERFVIFEVPRCHFRVKFRPFDPQEPQGPQSKVPAISIVAGPDTIFGETELGRYPASVCGEAGRQGDGEFLYLNRQRFLSLKSVHEAILFDALNQNITQESVLPTFTDQVLQDKLQCQEAVDEFLQCGDLDTKIKAIQLCARILTKRRVGLCVGIEALKAFTGCVQAVCSDKVLGCDVFNDVFEGQSCVSVRRVNQFCNQ